jgi:hypothetical protein
VLSDEGITLGTLIAFMQYAALFAAGQVRKLAQRFADILERVERGRARARRLLATEPAIARQVAAPRRRT